MSKLKLHFEIENPDRADLGPVALALRERLRQLPEVEDAEAMPTGQLRLTGVEVAAGIAAAVVVLRSGREAIEEVRKIVEEIKKLINAFIPATPSTQAGPVQSAPQPHVTNVQITNVIINTGSAKVPIFELSDDDLQNLARRLSA